MGGTLWMYVAGAGMWAVLIASAWSERRWPAAPNPDACPECSHECGLSELGRGQHCEHIDDNNGWSSDRCECQNDYHWNYEATAV